VHCSLFWVKTGIHEPKLAVREQLSQTLCGASLLAVCAASFMLRCHNSESLWIPFLIWAQRTAHFRFEHQDLGPRSPLPVTNSDPHWFDFWIRYTRNIEISLFVWCKLQLRCCNQGSTNGLLPNDSLAMNFECYVDPCSILLISGRFLAISVRYWSRPNLE